MNLLKLQNPTVFGVRLQVGPSNGGSVPKSHFKIQSDEVMDSCHRALYEMLTQNLLISLTVWFKRGKHRLDWLRHSWIHLNQKTFRM